MNAKFMNLFNLWEEANLWISKMVIDSTQRGQAKEKMKAFVEAFAAHTSGRRLGHYMHILHAHPEMFFSNEGHQAELHAELQALDNSAMVGAAAFSTTGHEKAHRMKKEAFRSGTTHNMTITVEVTAEDGTTAKKQITKGAGLYQVWQWHYRCVVLRLRQQLVDSGDPWVSINLTDIRAIANMLDGAGTWEPNWAESNILSWLGMPTNKKVYLRGLGKTALDEYKDLDLLRGITIQVTKASVAARDHVKHVRGVLVADIFVGDHARSAIDVDLAEQQRISKRARREAQGQQALAQSNIHVGIHHINMHTSTAPGTPSTPGQHEDRACTSNQPVAAPSGETAVQTTFE